MGYFSLRSLLTHKSDRIFLNVSRDLLLRRQQAVEGWALLGDCYAHGIMEGEALDETICRTFLIIYIYSLAQVNTL